MLAMSERTNLSDREMEILSLIAHGYVNKQIARRLGIACGTVDTHITRVLLRLGARTRAEAVHICAKRGIALQDLPD